MNLGDGGELANLIRFVEQQRVADLDPQASQALQDDAALRIGNALYGAVALGCFDPRIYKQHRTPLSHANTSRDGSDYF
jgi:hypothetical protein